MYSPDSIRLTMDSRWFCEMDLDSSCAMAANCLLYTSSEEDFSRLATLPQVGWSGKHPDFERWAPELEAENLSLIHI